MGGRLELRRRGALGWLSTLLGASVLTSCFQLTQAQDEEPVTKIPVTVQPGDPFVGGSVLLTPGGNPNFLFCSWHRGPISEESKTFFFYPTGNRQENGPGYTGRETGGPKCTLQIKNLTLGDSGVYTVRKDTEAPGAEVGEAEIKVTARPAGGKQYVMEKGLMAAIVVGAWLLLC